MNRLCSGTLLALAAAGQTAVALEGPAPAPSRDKLGAAAQELRLGAYGEVHYNNFAGPAKTDQVDVHRLVLMAEYSFTDRISFVGEVELEHSLVEDTADGSGPGELELEQAYIDFRLTDDFGIRGGVMLVPASYLNIYHEPTNFHGVERPVVQSKIVPTTWWEAGVGVYGRANDEITYQAMLSSTLDSDGFSASGIRGGRQKTAKAKANEFMLSGRADWRPEPGARIGAALAVGNTGQDEEDPDALLTLFTVDGSYTWNQVEVSGFAGIGTIDDAEELSPGTPEQFNGFYLTVAYDLFHHWQDAGDQTLQAFARYENWDTQAEVPDGTTEDESQIGDIIQVGLTYKPIDQVVIKADYQDWTTDADDAIDRWNLGIGFAF